MNIGYKKLRYGYIAKLEILGKNNEDRSDIHNSEYSLYRCSSAKVLSIFPNNLNVVFKKDPLTNIDSNEVPSIYDINFVYIVGDIVEVEDYDENIENVYSRGIYYFKCLERAQYWDEKDNIKTGSHKHWSDDGYCYSMYNFVNSKLNGPFVYMNGDLIHIKGNYKNNSLEGEYKEWYPSGRLYIRYFYVNGLLNGKFVEMTSDGRIRHNYIYKNNMRDWSQKCWFTTLDDIAEYEKMD